MDMWKYFGITHRDHVVCNPTSSEKLDELVGLLPLQPNSRVLDIACGKAELLLRIAERYQTTGVGVDISPYEFEAARQRVKDRHLEDQIEIVHADGADYDAPADRSRRNAPLHGHLGCRRQETGRFDWRLDL